MDFISPIGMLVGEYIKQNVCKEPEKLIEYIYIESPSNTYQFDNYQTLVIASTTFFGVLGIVYGMYKDINRSNYFYKKRSNNVGINTDNAPNPFDFNARILIPEELEEDLMSDSSSGLDCASDVDLGMEDIPL